MNFLCKVWSSFNEAVKQPRNQYTKKTKWSSGHYSGSLREVGSINKRHFTSQKSLLLRTFHDSQFGNYTFWRLTSIHCISEFFHQWVSSFDFEFGLILTPCQGAARVLHTILSKAVETRDKCLMRTQLDIYLFYYINNLRKKDCLKKCYGNISRIG